ncbi:hypothetical protein ACFTTN_13785 [Streptomyces niveus]|uniref:hypothetical protein n=1 Tax=Streptomyces niveus TaxID=193462 RepID=UPI0036396363
MSGFRSPRDYDSTSEDNWPYTSIDALLDADKGRGAGQPVSWSSVEITLLGVRARSDGKTGLAALKAMRREHPVLVHGLYTYLSVMALVLALIAASAIGG